MLDNLKTQITLAALAVKTLAVDFLGVTGDQITETAGALISLGLVVAAAGFRYAGTVRERKLEQVKEHMELKAQMWLDHYQLERRLRPTKWRISPSGEKGE